MGNIHPPLAIFKSFGQQTSRDNRDTRKMEDDKMGWTTDIRSESTIRQQHMHGAPASPRTAVSGLGNEKEELIVGLRPGQLIRGPPNARVGQLQLSLEGSRWTIAWHDRKFTCEPVFYSWTSPVPYPTLGNKDDVQPVSAQLAGAFMYTLLFPSRHPPYLPSSLTPPAGPTSSPDDTASFFLAFERRKERLQAVINPSAAHP
ncbi:uncharacterized protein SPSK_07961 [Sporothrix schenckii 1099-18]|uniref:Uncharacterized protein n=1 Tax=Sporothrix schenckii 1099-18 TaxID=1397361 RepID=A0A0F2MIK5_SPOSC|nr:uncharacterized protein SPSK_07961 [Sporothrix schenckii 1099-18]KJR88001.1 hypothetical protein SPSK_07961 [Sporothrix schenckii 1099-18]